jgi:3-hydroxyisobutyrate dehydrogenase-like beta-hydroxyacid dehydrogenase
MAAPIENQTLAMIGLGNMGIPMARNLLSSGATLTAYNRSEAPAQALAEAGARIGRTPADAITAGGIAISMLSNDAALEAVTLGPQGILAGLGQGGLHISMSTVSPATSQRLAALHAETGAQFVAAPVFGRPEAAAARKLWICLSGMGTARARARPVLEMLGQGVYDFGDDPGAANVVKLSGNFMILAAIEAMSEALALGEKNGVDRHAMIDFFTQANFSCPVYKSYGPILASQTYDPAGFKLELGMKDIRLGREIVETSAVPMPLADLLHARLLSAIAKGRGQLDWAAIEHATAEDAGLK